MRVLSCAGLFQGGLGLDLWAEQGVSPRLDARCVSLGDGPRLRLLLPRRRAGHPGWDPRAVGPWAEDCPGPAVVCQLFGGRSFLLLCPVRMDN